jgi:ribosomal protein S18 acetylase RimI-like enzyme
MQTVAHRHYKRYRMELDLQRWLGSQLRLPADYRLIPWDPRLLEEHAAVKYRSFRHELDARVFPCLGDYASCRQLMSDIQSKKGFLPEATWLIQFNGDRPTQAVEYGASDTTFGQLKEEAHTPDWHQGLGQQYDPSPRGPIAECRSSQFCGTIQAILTHRGRASIQNIGVTPSHRGKGLGRALLLASLIGLRRLKINRARLEVTAQNYHAVQLYRHIGFRTVRTLYKTVAVAGDEPAR